MPTLADRLPLVRHVLQGSFCAKFSPGFFRASQAAIPVTFPACFIGRVFLPQLARAYCLPHAFLARPASDLGRPSSDCFSRLLLSRTTFPAVRVVVQHARAVIHPPVARYEEQFGADGILFGRPILHHDPVFIERTMHAVPSAPVCSAQPCGFPDVVRRPVFSQPQISVIGCDHRRSPGSK
jgi:hypothetical protein